MKAVDLVLGVGAVALIAATGVLLPGLLDWHDSQRVWLGALLIAAAAPVAIHRRHPGAVMAHASRWGTGTWVGLLLVAALGTASASASGFVRLALLEVATAALLVLVMLTVMVAREQRPPRFDRGMPGILAVATAGTVVPFLVAWASALGNPGGYVATQVWQHGFSNPRFLGQFQTLTLPLVVTLCTLSWMTGYRRVGVWLVLLGGWLLALFTATRATWYSLAPAVALVALLAPRQVFRLLVPAVVSLAVAVPLAWLMFDVLPARLAGAESGAVGAFAARVADPLNLSLRDVLWTRALDLVREAPLLGIGPMGLALDPSPVAAHPHSAPLQLAAEWGVPAMLAFGIAAAFAGLRLIAGYRRLLAAGNAQEADRDRQALATGLMVALCAAAIHAQVDGLLVMPVAQGLLALLAGWAGSLLLDPAPAAAVHRPWAGPTLAFAAFAMATALVAGLLPELSRLQARSQARTLGCPDIQWKPRVWVDGSYWGEAGPPRRFKPLPPPPGCRPIDPSAVTPR